MRMKSLCLAAALVLAGFTSARAAVAPAENLLPADTLAFITVPDCNAFRASSKTSPPLMFWNDAAMKPFRDKFMAKLNETLFAPLEKDLGVKEADFAALPQGQFTIGVTVNGSTGHDDIPPGLVLLLDAKDKSDTLKATLDKLVKKWTADGRVLRTEKFHGLAFTVVPLSSNDFAGLFSKRPTAQADADAKPDKPGEIYFTQNGTLLVAANSAKVADALAARLTGGSTPVINDDAVFAADKPALLRDSPVYYGWFNGTKLFNLIAASGKNDSDDEANTPFPSFDPAKIIGATGLSGLKSASFAVRDRPEGTFGSFHLTAPESARAGLLKMLAFASKDAGIPAFVPADAVKFTRLRLDGRKAWAELQKMAAGISPQALAGLNSVIDMANTMAQQKNPAFDLRTYLFGNLGDDIIFYQKSPTGDSLAAISSPPALTLLAVANTDQAIDAIKTIAGLGTPQDNSATPRELNGHKIYTVALRPTRTSSAEPPQASNLYLSSAGGYLAISKDTGILEEYLRGAGNLNKALRDQPGLAEAASRAGGTSGGLFSYENQRETLRTTFKLLKNPATGGQMLFPPTVRDWLDFSLLPDFDLVAKYFYISIMSGAVNTDGMTIQAFTPRPPQLR